MELIQDEISGQIIDSAKKIVQEKSAGKITVRDILKELNITNRVFYNRFHNIDEVLDILYKETINKVRESLFTAWDGSSDFEDHIQKVAARTLTLTYESRQNMSQYIFEADSTKNTNYSWWIQEIRKLIQVGKENCALNADLDEEALSYSIWCFIRGFNADALARNLPEEEALRQFAYGFGIFLKGMK